MGARRPRPGGRFANHRGQRGGAEVPGIGDGWHVGISGGQFAAFGAAGGETWIARNASP
ncbi:MAG: hypothetical protein R3F11_31525 [Verrucomicrobiales bacterium]